MIFYALATACVGLALSVLLNALDEYIVYFYSPSELATNPSPTDDMIRVGGMVVDGSITRNGTEVQFVLTDYQHDVMVTYHGILPALFREGQGVVAEGYYNDMMFRADTILAKHDEYYMPPEVAKTLRNDTHDDSWKERTGRSLQEVAD